MENSDILKNILHTTIATNSDIFFKESFMAEIDDCHLYSGNTQTGQYIVIPDWQLPENQIETFAFSEGSLSFREFADSSFCYLDNYRGNFTYAEIAETREID